MSRSGKLAIALMCGMDRDHPIVKAVMDDPVALAADMMKGEKLSKGDLFDAIDGRHSFFDYRAVWENMDKIVEMLQENGEEISGADFRRVIINNKTAQDFALENSAVDKLFSPRIWKGQVQEMEKAWFCMPPARRDSTVFLTLKRAIAAADGVEIREDQLDRAGLKVATLRSAISGGNFAEVTKKFADASDHLRADDILLPDGFGDHMLDSMAAWNNFELLLDELEKNSERFDVRHFLHKHNEKKSPLEEALNMSHVKKIFSARVWKDRPAEMMELYAHVPAEKRSAIPIDDVLMEIEENIYSAKLNISPALRKGDLTSVMNEAAAGSAPTRGLGLKKTWDSIVDIRKVLQDKGEIIALDDLRQTSGQRDESILMIAARNEKFAQVMDILKHSGEELSLEDLTRRNKQGKNLLDVLTEKKQVSALLSADLWAHRPADFKKLWTALPDKGKDQVKYQELVSKMNLVRLRRRFADGDCGPSAAPAP